MGFIKDWVINIMALAVLIVIVESLMPSGKFKKYVGLVSGIMLVIGIINPFFKFFGQGLDINKIKLNNSYFVNQRELETDSKNFKEEEMKKVAEVYKKRLCEEAENCASDFEGVAGVDSSIEINEDVNSKKFGEIKKISLTIKAGSKKKPLEKGKVKDVQEVEVEKIEVSQKSVNNVAASVDYKLREKIKTSISELIGVKKECIDISFV